MSEHWFDVLVIDPPWKKKKGGARLVRPNQGKNFNYPTLAIEEINRLLLFDILPLANPIHAVFLWEVDSLLIEAEEMMLKQKYKRHCRFIWDKTNGIAPAFTVRYSHEYLVWWYKPKMLPINKEYMGKFTTVFQEAGRQHSRKPDFAYHMIDKLYPDAKKIDVFSREQRGGWSQWGNELGYYET